MRHVLPVDFLPAHAGVVAGQRLPAGGEGGFLRLFVQTLGAGHAEVQEAFRPGRDDGHRGEPEPWSVGATFVSAGHGGVPSAPGTGSEATDAGPSPDGVNLPPYAQPLALAQATPVEPGAAGETIAGWAEEAREEMAPASSSGPPRALGEASEGLGMVAPLRLESGDAEGGKAPMALPEREGLTFPAGMEGGKPVGQVAVAPEILAGKARVASRSPKVVSFAGEILAGRHAMAEVAGTHEGGTAGPAARVGNGIADPVGRAMARAGSANHAERMPGSGTGLVPTVPGNPGSEGAGKPNALAGLVADALGIGDMEPPVRPGPAAWLGKQDGLPGGGPIDSSRPASSPGTVPAPVRSGAETREAVSHEETVDTYSRSHAAQGREATAPDAAAFHMPAVEPRGPWAMHGTGYEALSAAASSGGAVCESRMSSPPDLSARVDLPDLAARIAAHVAPATGGSGAPPPAEIALSPVELGRLVIRFEADDTGGTLYLQVDRPETLELMRRNLDSLEASLRSLGYPGCDVMLGGRRPEAAPGQARPDHGGEEATGPLDAAPLRRSTGPGERRLDLRL